MKKVGFTLIVGLLLSISVPVAAFELVGELWALSDHESVSDQMSHINRGELTLINIGPVRLMGEGEFGGKITNLPEFVGLIRDDLDAEELSKLDDFEVLGGLAGRARVDWPLFNGVSVIGSVGYRTTGNVAKITTDTEVEIINNLYGGIVYAGGIGLKLTHGLQLSGVYEIGPVMDTIIGNDEAGIWNHFDVRLEYRLPLVLARAGYRYNELNVKHDLPYRTSGFYIGAGVHF